MMVLYFFNKDDKEYVDADWESIPRYLIDEIFEKVLRKISNDGLDIKIEISNDTINNTFVKTGKYTITEFSSGLKINKHKVRDWQDRSYTLKRIIDIIKLADYKLNTLEIDKENSIVRLTTTEI